LGDEAVGKTLRNAYYSPNIATEFLVVVDRT